MKILMKYCSDQFYSDRCLQRPRRTYALVSACFELFALPDRPNLELDIQRFSQTREKKYCTRLQSLGPAPLVDAMTDVDCYLAPLSFTETTENNGGDAANRSQFIDILEHLDPLPELPENAEDRFFNKDFDFQYASGPVETIFPVWGAGNSNPDLPSLAAAPTNLAANAAATSSQPVTTSPSTLATMSSPSVIKRTLPNPQESQHSRLSTIGQDRHVFLRQRLGGESVSSGNSSTSTSSDNGSASDDTGVTGGWGDGHGGNGTINSRAKAFVQAGVAFGGDGAAEQGVGVTPTEFSGVPGSQPPAKGARRKRQGGSTSNGRCRKSGRRDRHAKDGNVGRDARGVSASSGHRGYVPWDAFMRTFKQQWEQLNSLGLDTSLVPSANAISSGGLNHEPSPSLPAGICSVFSKESYPNDSTIFSIEQRSARAHSTAVASYVLRIRCGGGAHIVRRTWDDITVLCAMLRRELALAGAVPIGGSSTSGINAKSVAPAVAGVEFAPMDVVAPDAVSIFLHDLLTRQGMSAAMPVRRFLELEFLDGTMRGGSADCGREKAAREVASIAAAAMSTFATAVPVKSQLDLGGVLIPGLNGIQGSEGTASTTVGQAQLGACRPPSVVGAPVVPSLPAHPDAPRDLAAVCRCLGELGTAAFTGIPRGMPYWPAKVVINGSEASMSNVAPQKGMALTA